MDPHSHYFKMVFGILGNIIGVGVGLAPLATFWNIYKKKDTQGFSGLPYVVSLVSALIWMLYGLPCVTKHAFLVITINVATSTMQIFYLTIFLSYAPKKPKKQTIRIMAACFLLYSILAVLTLTVVPQKKRSLTVGSMGAVIGAVCYAAPLSVARMVARTRSVEFLPIVLCIFLFINSTIWTCYGIITTDIFLLLPNGIGVVLGVAQLSLYLIYRTAKPLDDFSDKGKGGEDSVLVMARMDIKSDDKPDGKPVKGDGNVQSTALPSQGGINGNFEPPYVPSNEAPGVAVIV